MVKQKESLKNSRWTSLLNFLFSPFFKRVNEINLKKKGPEIVESRFLRLADETVRLGVMSLYEHLACFPQSLCVFPRPGRRQGLAALCPTYLPKAADSVLKHCPLGSCSEPPPRQLPRESPCSVPHKQRKRSPRFSREALLRVALPSRNPEVGSEPTAPFVRLQAPSSSFGKGSPCASKSCEGFTLLPKAPSTSKMMSGGPSTGRSWDGAGVPQSPGKPPNQGGRGPAPAFVISQDVSLTFALQSNFNKISMYQIIYPQAHW